MQILDGKAVSKAVRGEIAQRVAEIKNKTGRAPALATILVGADAASKVYVNSKIKACAEVGMGSDHHELPATATEEEIINLIKKLNADAKISGILLQLPLPKGLNAEKCIMAIDPSKDVDGLHPYNAGMLTLVKNFSEIERQKLLVSCTPMGVIKILEHYNISPEGKHAVVLGRSNLVGKPVSLLMLSKNATVTMAHSRTANLREVCKTADILIAAIGKPKFVTKDFVKSGAVVIDVGINRTESGLCGDVDFEDVKNLTSAITPVPGGVGPMTITMLLHNTLLAFK
jgi:methylenetetrahydrofolate dehydrogenase (NADP+)/methenyltetrahydrofolate cyclohydrolase